MHVIDLRHLGEPNVVVSCLLSSNEGLVLIDPGPTSTFPTLRSGLEMLGVRLSDVRFILLTHIHLDHAGCTGKLIRENPRIRVVVHDRGARHLTDPERLINSARRVFGDNFDQYWGEIFSVPKENVVAVQGGEHILQNTFSVLYTPGHASHQVTYFDLQDGVAYVGDTLGVRILDGQFVCPCTPPPDFDLEAWTDSLTRLVAANPRRAFLTHSGVVTKVEEHVTRLREQLEAWTSAVRESLAKVADDPAEARRFWRRVTADLERNVAAELVPKYIQAVGPESCWYGVAHYWRRRSPPQQHP